jgi:hypothetical protein
MNARVIFILLLVLQGAAQPQMPGSVQGIIVESGTGSPLPGVTVHLRGGSNVSIAADSGSDGTFQFRNVPPGTYQIEARRAGYIPALYGGEQAQTATAVTMNGHISAPVITLTAPAISIASGQTLTGISIALTRGAVIYGRLVDDRGEVVVGATVEALRTTYRDGRRERIPVQRVVSNDLGEYRLFMLAPGEYCVRVSLGSEGLRQDTLYAVPVYFPGTIDAKEARNIELRAGETVAGLDFLAFPARMRRITGSVIGADGDGAAVLLSPRNSTEAMNQPVDPGSGAFEFKDVVPGPYLLVARTHSRRSAHSVDIGNVDVLNQRLPLGDGSPVAARVRIEGNAPGDDPELEKLYFAVRPELPLPGIEADLYSPFAHGRIRLNLLPGSYWIELTRPNDFYVKSMMLGGDDVLSRGLQVNGSSDVPLEIVVAKNAGSVEGRAEKGGVTVVLVPDAGRRANVHSIRRDLLAPLDNFSFRKFRPEITNCSPGRQKMAGLGAIPNI